MEKRQRHFVLVHGSCHGAWCWYKVATVLRSAGHRVTALDMAAAGAHPKRLDELGSFSDYIEPLMEFMASLSPEEKVILVSHSLGGISISVVMERFPHKVSVATFVTAFMPGPDFAFPTIVREFYRKMETTIDNQYTYGEGPHNLPTSVLFGPQFLSSKMYQLSPPEDLTLATMLVRPTRLFYSDAVMLKEAAVTKEKYGSVRRVYIVCDQDNLGKEDVQRWMIENNPVNEVKVVSGSDHMVMFSKPLELCSCLQGIADKYY